ncbi:MAG: Corrinoid transporter substrate-binding protein [Euryarchaeota archaeon]|nr:Corrinoid transporter substrate-binding protein [Euryarchaeota archaeon]
MNTSLKMGLIILLILAASSIAMAALPGDEKKDSFTLQIFGNANMDGQIDDADKDLLKEIIAGSKEPTNLSDANLDGKIDSSDLDLVDRLLKHEPANITIIDSANRIVSLEVPVEGFAGLHTSPCREFMMLGIEDRVVGVTNYVFDDPDLYPRLLDKTNIGTIYEPNYEAIATAKPDVLIMTPGSYIDPVLPMVEPMGIEVIGLSLNKADYDSELMLLGYISGKPDRVKDFLDWKQKTLDMIAERTKDLDDSKRLRVFSATMSSILKGDKELSPSLIGQHQIIDKAGAINVADGIPTGNKVDGEWILDQDPDSIIIASYFVKEGFGYTVLNDTIARESLRTILESDILNQTRAAREGKIFILGYYGTASGGQDPIGVAYLAKRFYPDLFQDLDPLQLQKEYFERWFSIPNQGLWAYP